MALNKFRSISIQFNSLTKQMKDSIFYSDDEQSNFQVVAPSLKDYQPQDSDAYIISMIDSKSLSHGQQFCSNNEDDNSYHPVEIKKKQIKKKKSQIQVQSIQTQMPKQSKDNIQIQNFNQDQIQDSEFSPNSFRTQNRDGKKKPRISDQNICKKYHTIGNKCLRKLGLYKDISSYIDKVHKRNYFIIILMIASKKLELDEFIKLYMEQSQQEIIKCQKILKSGYKGSKQYKKNKQLRIAIHNSLKALKQFKEGNLEQALQELYDRKNLKRLQWINQGLLQVLKIGQTINTN